MTKEHDLNQLIADSRFYTSERLYNRALESIDKLLKHFPEEELGWWLKGEILIYKGDIERAYKHINKALELNSESIITLHIMSFLEISRGNYDNAIEVLKKSLKLYPYLTNYLELFDEDQLLFLFKIFKDDPNISSENLEFIKKQIELKQIQRGVPKEDYERANFLSFLHTIKDILKKKKLRKFARLYEKRAWDTLTIDYMREILEDPKVNLLENLFRLLYPLILNKNLVLVRELNYVYLLPKRFLKGLRELIKIKVIEIIEKKEEETLIPLFAYNFLSVLDLEDVILLIKNPEIKFLQLIYHILYKNYDELLNFLGDELIYDFMEVLDDHIKMIKFEEFEIEILNEIELFFKKELLKNQIFYFQNFNLMLIEVQRVIKKKNRKDSEFNMKEIIGLAKLASKGIDDIANGVIGFDGYGFVFRDITYIEKKMKIETYYTPLIDIGKMRYIMKALKNGKEIHEYELLGFDLNLLLTASVKTLVPDLKLGLGDTFFITWMLVKSPYGEIFPANFYYDRNRMAIGCLNQKFVNKNTDIPNEFAEIFIFNPYNLSEDEREELAEAFESAIKKVPRTDFKAVFSGHDYYYDVEVDHGLPYWKLCDGYEDFE